MNKFQVGDLVTTNRSYNLRGAEVGALLTILRYVDTSWLSVETDGPGTNPDDPDDFYAFPELELELVVWP